MQARPDPAAPAQQGQLVLREVPQRLPGRLGQRVILAPPDLLERHLRWLGLQDRLEQQEQLPPLLVQLGRQVIPARPGLPEPRLPLLDLLDLPAILALQVRQEPPLLSRVRPDLLGQLVLLVMRLLSLGQQVRPVLQALLELIPLLLAQLVLQEI